MDSNITVMIPTYNAGAFLTQAVDSVFKQTYRKWKLIIVDDASTDNSIELLSDYLKDPRVTLIKNTENMGQSKSQNKAVALVDTPYVVQLDADDWFFPHTLSALLRAVKDQPKDIAVFYGNFLSIYEDEQGNFIKSIVEKGRLYTDKYEFLFSDRTFRPRCYRTDLLKKVGGWPIDGPFEGRFGEDKRMLLRLIEYYRFYWIDQVLYQYRRHSHNMSSDPVPHTYVREYRTYDCIKRWGNHYKPIFKCNSQGWNYLVKLKPKGSSKHKATLTKDSFQSKKKGAKKYAKKK